MPAGLRAVSSDGVFDSGLFLYIAKIFLDILVYSIYLIEDFRLVGGWYNFHDLHQQLSPKQAAS
jgi:hypothetical protein